METVNQLLSARKGLTQLTQSIMRLQLQQKELPYAADSLEPAIVALLAQVKVLDAKIAITSREEKALAETMDRLIVCSKFRALEK